MKKVYRQPKTKSVNLRTESLMDGDGDVHFGLVTPGSGQQGPSGFSKRQGNTVFDDLFDKVEGPSDMTTVEENDYSTHTTVE